MLIFKELRLTTLFVKAGCVYYSTLFLCQAFISAFHCEARFGNLVLMVRILHLLSILSSAILKFFF